ncbi:MAG: DnaA regulatory inactivator Hda [Methylococcaceae bacterium]|jgi:DnaA family protein
MQQLPLQFEFKGNQSFENFYAINNQELLAHLQQCSAGVGDRFIYLCGKKGQGKSHLLHASCRHAQSHQRSSFYFSFLLQDFPNPDLFNGLDSYELICFDNIEQIAGLPHWEQAVFNLFNQLWEQGHHLIVSSSKLPNASNFQLTDLKTRLNGGLTLAIQALSDDEKIAALSFRAKQMGFEISPQAGQFLLAHYNRDLAALWLLLEHLDQASLAAQRKLTVPFLKQILASEHDL